MKDERIHSYTASVTWTGNLGRGTAGYRGYSRDYEIQGAGKPVIAGSSDPAFRGDPARYNPEELLVASLATCHMLWFLHLCADVGITVTAYRDQASGAMIEDTDGGGRFREATLRPRVIVAPGSDPALAQRLHEEAHRKCFIANSVNFPVIIDAHVDIEP